MKKIILDCERMKYPHTGLYHYCLQLGRALQQEVSQEEQLIFYLRKDNKNAFGDHASYLIQNPLDKFFPSLKKADVWHCTYQASNYFPFRKRVKKLLTVHDLNVLHENKFSAARIKKETEKIQRRIDGADHVVAISNFVLNDIQTNLQLGDTPATVIYNGCNFQKIEQPVPPALNPGDDFLFTIGTINAKKNFHVLPCLLAGNKKKLVIAGVTDDEQYRQQIISEAKKYDAADRVLFTGGIGENDKQWYLQHCEAFLFPSLAEGFGLPVIEAMYFGLPVILSRLTALPEIGSDAAFYFDSFEPAAMQQVFGSALKMYNADPARKEKIKTRASFFSWQKAAAKYLEVYRSLY